MNGIQKLLLTFSDSLEERYLKPNVVQKFIYRNSEKIFQDVQKKGFSEFSEEDQERILTIQRQLSKLGMKPALSFSERKGTKKTIDKCYRWLTDLPDRLVIKKGVLVYPAAENLLSIVQESKGNEELLDKNMERLLRHIEVNRRKAFSNFAKKIPRRERIEECCRYSLLFCRYAALKNDWRYLNAALKMNEWLWQDYRHPLSKCSSLSLLADLVEQEFTLREMEKC